LGAGWEPFKGFAFGANISYLWGTLNRSFKNTYSDSYVNTLSKNYTTQVKSYKLDLGLQYTYVLDRKNELTLGLAYSLGHKLDAEPECNVISTNSQTSVSDTTRYVVSKALELPHTFGVGLLAAYLYDHSVHFPTSFPVNMNGFIIRHPPRSVHGIFATAVALRTKKKQRPV